MLLGHQQVDALVTALRFANRALALGVNALGCLWTLLAARAAVSAFGVRVDTRPLALHKRARTRLADAVGAQLAGRARIVACTAVSGVDRGIRARATTHGHVRRALALPVGASLHRQTGLLAAATVQETRRRVDTRRTTHRRPGQTRIEALTTAAKVSGRTCVVAYTAVSGVDFAINTRITAFREGRGTVDCALSSCAHPKPAARDVAAAAVVRFGIEINARLVTCVWLLCRALVEALPTDAELARVTGDATLTTMTGIDRRVDALRPARDFAALAVKHTLAFEADLRVEASVAAPVAVLHVELRVGAHLVAEQLVGRA